jgi:hypothetical protein
MRKTIVSIALLGSILTIYAQQPKDTLNTEIIQVVKPYEPTISDAFKVDDVPQNDENVVPKDSINYQINSVPVASTFTPAKGKAKGVTRPKKERLYDNYISVGFGNYTSPLIDAYVRSFPNRDAEVGAILYHHSSQGGIKEVQLDDSFYNTKANLYYNLEDRDRDFKIDLNLRHDIFNWYGLPEFLDSSDQLLESIDPKHSYFFGGASGVLNNYDSFFEGGKITLSYFGDSYKSSEQHIRLQPTFELPISSELISFDLDINYLNGSSDKDYYQNDGNKYSFVNLGITPNFEVLRDQLSINLGAKLYYAVDLENSEGAFKAYPNVDASYELVEEVLTVFAGATGGLTFNEYSKHTQENPFLSPSFQSIPTNEKYKFYGGIKGKLATNISYLFSGSYADVEHLAMYQLQPFNISIVPEVENQPYHYANSFGMVYNNANVVGLEGELTMDLSKEFTLGGNVKYNIYSMEKDVMGLDEYWNLPAMKTTLYADFHQGPWQASAKLFMMSERKDLELPFTLDTFYGNVEDYIVTNGTFMDLNASLSYSFTERLSAFAKAHNLLTDHYYRYRNYPVQGLQVLGGITYKFDL